MTQPRPDPSYRLRTTLTVRRALAETLPEAVATAAYEFMTGPLLSQPYRVGKRLLPPLDDRFSARRGTYRIIYRIDDDARVVTVVDVGAPPGYLPDLNTQLDEDSGRAAEGLALGRDQGVAGEREDLGLRADQDLGHVAGMGQPGDQHPRLRPARPFLVQLDPYAHLAMIAGSLR